MHLNVGKYGLNCRRVIVSVDRCEPKMEGGILQKNMVYF